MNVLFDTSVLVPAVVDQLANHTACFHLFAKRTTAPNQGFCSTHALAECYSVLTALPLRRRVTPDEAGCSRIYTYNTDHFLSLVSSGLQVTAP